MSTPAEVENEKPDALVEVVKTVVWAVLLALCIRSVAFEPFNIPSGSMLPNLLVGDYLFVSKYTYGYSRHSFPFGIAPIDGRWWPAGDPGAPKRGDIIVFKLPSDTSTDYIKRVIGMSGDRIQVINGQLYINSERVKREQIGMYEAEDGAGRPQLLKHYIETLPGGVTHEILELSDREPLDNTPVFQVPEGHFFMMGDNRDNSQDSRVQSAVGFVPLENVVGPARLMFFSRDSGFKLLNPLTWPEHIRWQRLLRAVR